MVLVSPGHVPPAGGVGACMLVIGVGLVRGVLAAGDKRQHASAHLRPYVGCGAECRRWICLVAGEGGLGYAIWSNKLGRR